MTEGIKSYWVKKYISNRDWNDYYSRTSSYCYLGEEGVGKNKRVKIGFLVAERIPIGCEECDDKEILQIDDYRRANNIRPFPCEKEEEKKFSTERT